jgi:hypothetical protein
VVDDTSRGSVVNRGVFTISCPAWQDDGVGVSGERGSCKKNGRIKKPGY